MRLSIPKFWSYIQNKIQVVCSINAPKMLTLLEGLLSNGKKPCITSEYPNEVDRAQSITEIISSDLKLSFKPLASHIDANHKRGKEERVYSKIKRVDLPSFVNQGSPRIWNHFFI